MEPRIQAAEDRRAVASKRANHRIAAMLIK
jgi:hypothetical protein